MIRISLVHHMIHQQHTFQVVKFVLDGSAQQATAFHRHFTRLAA